MPIRVNGICGRVDIDARLVRACGGRTTRRLFQAMQLHFGAIEFTLISKRVSLFYMFAFFFLPRFYK